MYRYARTKTASGSNLQDAFSKLCHSWNGEVCAALAKKLGWRAASYSSGDFLVNDPVRRGNHLKGILSTKSMGRGADRTIFNLEIVGEVNGQAIEGEISVHSSSAAVNDIVWMLGDEDPTVWERTASVDSLQRKVDEIADAIQKVTAELKRNGPDAALQTKLERLQTEWTRSLMTLDEAIQRQMDSVPFDSDAAWGE